MTQLTLITREGCHLCVEAERTVHRVASVAGAVMETVDVDTDPELRETFGDYVPVVLLNGKLHDYWRIDESRLLTACGYTG